MADSIETKIRQSAGLIADDMMEVPVKDQDEDDEDGFAEVAAET